LPYIIYGLDSQTITVQRLLIKNNGEKPVTIESLVKESDKDGIFGYSETGERWDIERSVHTKYIKMDLFSKYFIPSEIDTLEYFDIKNGLILNKKLEPGENLQLNLLFAHSTLKDNIETIVFDATLKLSDNKKVLIHLEFDGKIRPRGR
jgi:hypothetical protein